MDFGPICSFPKTSLTKTKKALNIRTELLSALSESQSLLRAPCSATITSLNQSSSPCRRCTGRLLLLALLSSPLRAARDSVRSSVTPPPAPPPPQLSCPFPCSQAHLSFSLIPLAPPLNTHPRGPLPAAHHPRQLVSRPLDSYRPLCWNYDWTAPSGIRGKFFSISSISH